MGLYKDGRSRCFWANPKNERYIRYHDEEWGQPVYDDKKLFEMLILESFQAGLSWECILNKREAFREAFDGFDLKKVCGYQEEQVERLMQNKEIIRNRRKITASIKNANIFLEIQKEFGSFSDYLWHFTGHEVIYETGKTTSELSDTVSADLYKRGMRFVGSTIIYSYLQAVGIIYSHEDGCYLSREKTGERG
ncbi:MAG: DNA-3-methyladenine glycosylase I [Eubacterium sp.]|nr:DNA-3-methyladenine glycosylase I [Eubacterium sp.]